MKNLSLLFFCVLLSTLGIKQTAKAVAVPAVFSDHMVLQQNAEVTIWGWANPSEEVKVTCSWDNNAVKTKGNNLAQWHVKIKTPIAGGPHTLTIKGYNTIEIKDVLMGEVWLCSGQSNMEWTTRAGVDNAQLEIAKANYPSIRFFTVPRRSADGAQLDVDARWIVCTPETMPNFSAVGYFFGQRIHENLKMPVGLINSSWGGTPAEIWVNAKTITENKDLAEAAAKLKEEPYGPNKPGKAFNAMIAPLTPYRIAGALWYQGESNTSNPQNYEKLLPALIQNWRTEWGYAFPFYFVQIAPYSYGDKHNGVLLRDAQRKSLSVPNTGMVVISDVGNIKDIHPRNKIPVGQRLANWALNKTYGKEDVVFSGPLYKSMKTEGNKIRLSFDYAETGLAVKGKELTLFEIAGADQKFVPATAKIAGNTIVVQAKSVKNPMAVRFAWSDTAEPNLFNKAGLPASSFRTDDWPIK
ncbi:9-O-acetylesterase [Adhaeribacter aerolatus]|uniref:9-O-acetylesterase n=1 Tax=Adhaeribacter aerolatus TaxID=670289 RepID=A0A512B5G7_9BACT|nr:sialate O-acetylesterase [Adhaeribacter aerolatus]GEO07200.1 9-O-acetylesterase [Adhaeribacter aerolatus]